MKSKKFKYIDVIIDNQNSWMWKYMSELEDILNYFSDNVRIFKNSEDIKKGDILFILSCDKILKAEDLNKHKNNIVIHASDLPKGRGWSPWSWEIENGAEFLTLTLFEAKLELDSGDWYLKKQINLDGNELIDEIRKVLVSKEFEMINEYLMEHPIHFQEQSGIETHYKKRTFKNQELDIDKSIKEQFNKLRVCDNENYPAHFFIDMGGGESKNIHSKYIKNNTEFIYMKYLDWDTNFFAKKSYNLDITKSNFLPNKNIMNSLVNSFLGSFVSVKLNTRYDYNYSDFLQQCGFKYIDTELELKLIKQVDLKLNDNVKVEKLEQNINLPYEQLGSSFSMTRFHTDLNIRDDKADLLWIEYLKNFMPDDNKHLYIAKVKDEIVGVVLVNIFEKVANIFYIAVLDSFREYGVGTQLMGKVIKDFKGFKIKTGTQIKNIKALNFYVKNGFIVENTNTVFHRWS